MSKNSYIKIEINRLLNRAEITDEWLSYEYATSSKKKSFDNKVHLETLNYLLDMLPNEFKTGKESKIRKIFIILDQAMGFHLKLNDNILPNEIAIKIKDMQKHFEEYKKEHPDIQDSLYITGIAENIFECIDNGAPELKNEEDLKIAQALQKTVDNYKEHSEKLQKKIEELTEENKKLKKEIKALKKEIKSLNQAETISPENAQKIKETEEELARLKKELSKLKQDYKDLQKNDDELNKKIEQLEIELSDAKEQLDKIEKKEKANANQQEKKDKLANLIMGILINHPTRLDILLKKLKKEPEFKDLNFQEILRELKIKISKDIFENGIPIIGIDKSFEQAKPKNLIEPAQFDCIFIAGMNLNIDYDTKRTIIDHIFYYCTKNNINYIISLGDIYDINLESQNFLEQLRKIETVTNRFLLDYPYQTGINTFILGGNNEKVSSNLGYDVLSEIEKSRIDLYSLGYGSSKITLNNPQNWINLVAPLEQKTNSEILSLFTQKRKKEDIFVFNAIATQNRAVIDLNTRTILIPPLVNDDLGCSIYHVQFEVQDDNIHMSQITPINMNNNYMQTSKIYSYNNLGLK